MLHRGCSHDTTLDVHFVLQVERLLGRVDAAIYLLDYTKLKTAEEAGVLSRLKAINPQLVSRLCSRLFFAGRV